MLIAGIDGCKGGWLLSSAKLSGNQFLQVTVSVHVTFRELIAAFGNSPFLAAVDMPIGLPKKGVRICDAMAKRMLGAYGSRIFFAPPRKVLNARCPQEMQAMSRCINGKGVAIPVWGILNRICEIDSLMSPGLQESFVEFYPELTFLRLAGKILPSKHTAVGLRIRRSLLAKHLGILPQKMNDMCASFRGRGKPDDLYDSLAGLITAKSILNRTAGRIPTGEPPIDQKRLRMEIWY